MTFHSIMESISHLGKMARTSAKSENPNEVEVISSSQFTRFSHAILLSETVFNSDNLFLHVLKAIAS